ncbi:MAG: methylmalonyl Co-A mutase-associated GTPase MeaB [Hyphomicrobiales bacterium]|nr:methylmalonyl Co-A mutase-associated GTPase MeaB [Hyphomicrobiales bacterium]MCP5371979.1 methylmalonyl Co-A mutase-associated GTPase MeaB [Hyphomicrobiales bacterium]
MAAQARNADYYRDNLLSGNRVALARAITAVENDRADAAAVLQTIYGQVGRAQLIGITGAPGAGKSTLVNAVVRELRGQDRKVGVVAVDPSSPFSGGAILGDRIRMSEHGNDDGVFVRSLASRGHLGGLSRAAARVVDVMDAAGMDAIIVETVGTGQSEVEIMEIAQTVVVVCAPGLGDEIQAVKAGILEIADILVVNKADMPLADRTERQLRDAMRARRRDGWEVPVMRTVATTGDGTADLVAKAAEHFARLPAAARVHAARGRMHKLLAATAAEQVRAGVQGLRGEAVDALCEAVLRGEMDYAEAARRAARLAVADPGSGHDPG